MLTWNVPFNQMGSSSFGNHPKKNFRMICCAPFPQRGMMRQNGYSLFCRMCGNGFLRPRDSPGNPIIVCTMPMFSPLLLFAPWQWN
jgi:hypothetical protein